MQGIGCKICRSINYPQTFLFSAMWLIYLIDWLQHNKCLSPPESWSSACVFPNVMNALQPPFHLPFSTSTLSLEINHIIVNIKIHQHASVSMASTKRPFVPLTNSDQKYFVSPEVLSPSLNNPMRNGLA